MNAPLHLQRPANVAVTGVGWQIPRFADRRTLDDALRAGPHEPRFNPADLLGRKGLRYKERATLLALCAARTALADARIHCGPGETLDDAHFGVVVASNTGNLDTVCHTAEVIHRDHVNAASAMDLPNASSNVISAGIAIRFGLKALNLTVCSGAAASLDALVLAANAIRNGRARRILVTAVEADGHAARSLLAGRRLLHEGGLPAVMEGAGAVVLEDAAAAAERAATAYALLGRYAFGHADAAAMPALDALVACQPHADCYLSRHNFAGFGLPALRQRRGRTIDLGALAEDAYGAASLFALIHRCEQLRAGAAHDTALLFGGGSWGDRRAGALAVDGPGTMRASS